MVENLVKPITESLQILRGSLQPTQADTSMDTNVTPEEVRSPIVKDTTTQVIDEYMDQECRKCSIIIHSMQEKHLLSTTKRLVCCWSPNMMQIHL